MYEAYRVRKVFGWSGWMYAPNKGGACECDCATPKAQGRDEQGKEIPDQSRNPQCLARVASTCSCKDSICRCSCGIEQGRYAGDIWIVEAGHPRKDMMLFTRKASSDASIQPIDDLLETQAVQRHLVPWRPREPVAA